MPDNPVGAMRTEIIGDATLYLGDCREILPTLGKVDAVVTDPPYGIGADKGQANRANKRHGKAIVASRDYGESDWDQEPCDPAILQQLLGMSDSQIMFGGNYFELPAARCWLVWDKLNGENDYADCELAWTNLDKPVRRIVWQWHGMIRKGKEDRDHPTQKPLGVMKWCIQQLPADAQTILDPFMGSGTTGVACAKLGRKFIGIEISEKYFNIAVKRITDAYRQRDLFVNVEADHPKPTQMPLLPQDV